jgi:hypothetical protein
VMPRQSEHSARSIITFHRELHERSLGKMLEAEKGNGLDCGEFPGIGCSTCGDCQV